MKEINLNSRERECMIASKRNSPRYDLQIGDVKVKLVQKCYTEMEQEHDVFVKIMS